MSDINNFTAQVLMLVGTHCQHCAPVLKNLSELVKEGAIESLEVVNVEKKPDVAVALGVQSVPWIRFGWFELEGVRSKSELKRWAENVGTDSGVSEYYAEILAQGRVAQCLRFLQQYPETMSSIITLISDPDEKINVKLGVGVIMEEYATTEGFKVYIPKLVEYLKHDDARIRQDVCHYLALTENPDVLQYVESLLHDDSADVREEAVDSVEALKACM